MLINYEKRDLHMLSSQINIDKLKQIGRVYGIDDDDLFCYLIVLQNPNVTVNQISKSCDFDRTKVYRIIGKLESVAMLEKTCTNPVKIHAVPPQTILENIITKKQDELDRMTSEIKNEFMKELQVFDVKPNSDVKIGLISGHDLYLSCIQKELKEAQWAMMFCSELTLKRAFYTKLPDVIKNNKKLKIYMIASKHKTLVTRLKPTESRIRNSGLDHDILITDKTTIAEMGDTRTMRSFNEKSSSNYIKTNSPYLFYMLKGYLECLWNAKK